MPNVLVVGSIALDDIEAPAGSRKSVLGGAASHAGVAASFFAPVRAVGVIGDDFPDEHLEYLRSCGIDTAGVERAPGRTFRWGGRYHANLNERDTLFTELGVFEAFDPQIPRAYRASELVFLANIHPDLQRGVLSQADERVFAAMDTMNFWIESTPDELRATLSQVDGVIINDQEAQQLTGEANLVVAAELIRAIGPHTVIIKRGESGALLFDAEGVFAAPAFPLREVVDPTGAGDSFAGGFMGALSRDGDLSPEGLRRAVIYGSVLASFCVERFGLDRMRELDNSAIEARFEEFRALTRF